MQSSLQKSPDTRPWNTSCFSPLHTTQLCHHCPLQDPSKYISHQYGSPCQSIPLPEGLHKTFGRTNTAFPLLCSLCFGIQIIVRCNLLQFCQAILLAWRRLFEILSGIWLLVSAEFSDLFYLYGMPAGERKMWSWWFLSHGDIQNGGPSSSDLKMKEDFVSPTSKVNQFMPRTR